MWLTVLLWWGYQTASAEIHEHRTVHLHCALTSLLQQCHRTWQRTPKLASYDKCYRQMTTDCNYSTSQAYQCCNNRCLQRLNGTRFTDYGIRQPKSNLNSSCAVTQQCWLLVKCIAERDSSPGGSWHNGRPPWHAWAQNGAIFALSTLRFEGEKPPNCLTSNDNLCTWAKFGWAPLCDTTARTYLHKSGHSKFLSMFLHYCLSVIVFCRQNPRLTIYSIQTIVHCRRIPQECNSQSTRFTTCTMTEHHATSLFHKALLLATAMVHYIITAN